MVQVWWPIMICQPVEELGNQSPIIGKILHSLLPRIIHGLRLPTLEFASQFGFSKVSINLCLHIRRFLNKAFPLFGNETLVFVTSASEPSRDDVYTAQALKLTLLLARIPRDTTGILYSGEECSSITRSNIFLGGKKTCHESANDPGIRRLSKGLRTLPWGNCSRTILSSCNPEALVPYQWMWHFKACSLLTWMEPRLHIAILMIKGLDIPYNGWARAGWSPIRHLHWRGSSIVPIVNWNCTAKLGVPILQSKRMIIKVFDVSWRGVLYYFDSRYPYSLPGFLRSWAMNVGFQNDVHGGFIAIPFSNFNTSPWGRMWWWNAEVWHNSGSRFRHICQ